jgi:Icc-related predicted phosphoesterase
MTKICVISDTHCKWNKLIIPPCDILISAGDYSFRGELHVVKDFHKWLHKQPAKHIISLQGNHEKMVESNFAISKQTAEEVCPGVIFIDEGLVELEGLKIYTSAITPFFFDWAWNRYPGEEIQKHWDLIPSGMDIIVTHGPVFGILDGVLEFDKSMGEMGLRHCGCPSLLKKVFEIKPKYHICGHIHPGYGREELDGINFINASICDDDYRAVNAPITFEI